jgi:predicted Zn-dependent protease
MMTSRCRRALTSRASRGHAALLLLLAACAPAARHAPPAAPPAPAAAAPVAPAAPARLVIPPVDGAANYVDQVLAAQEGHVVRWDRTAAEPIRLFIPPLPAAARTGGADYPAIVARAMAAWNDVGLPVLFERVSDSTGADVLLRWVRTDAEADVAGRARLRIGGWTDRIRSATLALTTQAPSGYPHSADAMLGYSLHELGHVLGLQHAGLPECVMFPIPQRATLCDADRETARRWYALPTGRVAVGGSY